MIKIFQYSYFDLFRSRWVLMYTAFYLLLTFALLFLSYDLSKVIVSLMNIVLILVPLIATMFGVMFYYNSREFTELLLAQPIKRSSIFVGQYAGLAASLSTSVLIGIGLPFAMFGIFQSAEIGNYTLLILLGISLSFIFSGIAFFIALQFDNRIKGFGIAILVWLFLAVIYDGLLLLGLAWFSDYPLENVALAASLFNPIDLSRILMLLKLDISALMGFTGAVFRQFFGQSTGMIFAMLILGLWTLIPYAGIRWRALQKDF